MVVGRAVVSEVDDADGTIDETSCDAACVVVVGRAAVVGAGDGSAVDVGGDAVVDVGGDVVGPAVEGNGAAVVAMDGTWVVVEGGGGAVDSFGTVGGGGLGLGGVSGGALMFLRSSSQQTSIAIGHSTLPTKPLPASTAIQV